MVKTNQKTSCQCIKIFITDVIFYNIYFYNHLIGAPHVNIIQLKLERTNFLVNSQRNRSLQLTCYSEKINKAKSPV